MNSNFLCGIIHVTLLIKLKKKLLESRDEHYTIRTSNLSRNTQRPRCIFAFRSNSKWYYAYKFNDMFVRLTPNIFGQKTYIQPKNAGKKIEGKNVYVHIHIHNI